MSTALHKSAYGPSGTILPTGNGTECSVAPSEPARWVYFAERDGLVKIGYSANVEQRMRQLGARLLAVMPGGARMERIMHGYFAEYRVHGEWFHPGMGLKGFIEALLGDDPYRKVGLPEDYWHAEVDRLVAEDRAERARAESAKNAQELTVGDVSPAAGYWPRPIPGDQAAAEIIGRLLTAAIGDDLAWPGSAA